ncbi:hypothetical protein E8E14_001236 [Neopestalotiopsis sp. 37M]|nr:hypothetical protein E8E14_001236 [Neopestalotiopsis sp. 37M]
MSHLRYAAYSKHGEGAKDLANMSQSARYPLSGEVITISGQGGWDRENSKVAKDLKEEYDRAFDNVNHALIDIGGKGMSQVYKVVIYLAPLQDEAQDFLFQNLKKWFPDHSPLVSVFGIEKLSLEGMRIEIEAWAHVPA